jgi:hypothetical protein
MSEDVNRAYELWRESAEKFDYFMAGLCAAVLGYLAPKFESARIGFNPESVELLALLSFVGAFFASFKRLESTVHLQRIGIGRLEELEAKERLENAIREGTTILDSDTKTVMDREKVQALLETRKSIVEISRTMEKSLGTKAVRWYTVRYYLLVAGFLLLIAARVWKGYQ